MKTISKNIIFKKIISFILIFSLAAGSALCTLSPVDVFAYKSDNPDFTGVDVSYWQGDVDWKKAASQIDFVILRAGHSPYADTLFDYNASQCEKYHIPYGVYWYSTAKTKKQAKKEAKKVIKALKNYTPDLPVFWDVEDSSVIGKVSNSTMSKMAFAFCNTVAKAGYKAGVYSSSYYWHLYLKNFAKKDTKYHHWVAEYNSRYVNYGDSEAIAAGGKSWASYASYQYYNIWQYSSQVNVSWTQSDGVDGDYWYGKLNLSKMKKVSAKGNTLKVKWKKASSATAYEIYRKTGADGEYSHIATSSSDGVYVDNDVTSGNEYYYKVKIITGTGATDITGEKGTVYLDTPELTKAKAKSGKKIKLKWGQSSGALGYEIQYSLKESFKKAKTVKIEGSLKTTLNKLKKNKTYYIRVRAFATTSKGRKAYSDWSEVKKVKVK